MANPLEIKSQLALLKELATELEQEFSESVERPFSIDIPARGASLRAMRAFLRIEKLIKEIPSCLGYKVEP